MTIILNDTDFMTVDELEKEIGWPHDWTSVKGLYPYIKRLQGDVTGIEIGTCRAESTYLILDKCPNVTKLYTIDPYLGYDDWAGELNQETMSKFEDIAHKNMMKFGDRVEFIKSRSDDAETINYFKDEQVDFIFVDGDHSEEATYQDISNYYSKLRSGGLFSGHDYNLDAVRTAVERFRTDNKVRVNIQLSTNNVWFWYK
jgi:predicted O-methyltransferase YrrM